MRSLGQDLRNHGAGVNVTADDADDVGAHERGSSFILRRPACSCDEDGTNRSDAEALCHHFTLETIPENLFRESNHGIQS